MFSFSRVTSQLDGTMARHTHTHLRPDDTRYRVWGIRDQIRVSATEVGGDGRLCHTRYTAKNYGWGEKKTRWDRRNSDYRLLPDE